MGTGKSASSFFPGISFAVIRVQDRSIGGQLMDRSRPLGTGERIVTAKRADLKEMSWSRGIGSIA
jgi:hypothetical protein